MLKTGTNTGIHQTAIVHPDAQVGKEVSIGPFAIIEKDTIIGAHTTIGAHGMVLEGARIGSHCEIYTGAIISAIPQDLKYKGEKTLAFVGDHTIVREYVTISRGTQQSATKVGTHCLLMAYVHVAHDCGIGNHCILANSVQLGGHVVLEDWATIGGLVAVHQFVRIGTHAMVSGTCGVLTDVPPYSLTVTDKRAKYHGINVIGLRRRNFSDKRIETLRDIFGYLYHNGMNRSDALKKIEKEMPNCAEKDNILDFIRESKRGIVRGYQES